MVALLNTAVVLFTVMNVLLAKPSQQEDLSHRLETLELKYDKTIAMLVERMVANGREYDRKTAELEKRIFHLENENKELIDDNYKINNTILSLSKIMDRMSANLNNNDEDVQRDKGQEEMMSTQPRSDVQRAVEVVNCKPSSRQFRGLDDHLNIAFTAYLDHDLERQGKDQIVTFNRILLNDGNGYNNYTGVFTAPVPGVYSITFFVGERDTNEARAYLVVNNQHKVDAAVEALHATQDLQGGNTANLLLNKGDAVYVTHQGAGTHIEGADYLRTTTFSGFLIYPVEAPNIVGK